MFASGLDQRGEAGGSDTSSCGGCLQDSGGGCAAPCSEKGRRRPPTPHTYTHRRAHIYWLMLPINQLDVIKGCCS